MRAAVVASLVVVSLAGVAGAQEARVVRDEWRAEFRGAREVGWGHERIEERPGARGDEAAFVIVQRSWTPTTEGELRFESRTETDAGGRVRRRTTTQVAPWGTTTTRVEPGEEGGLRYEVQVRDRPALEGALEDAWSETILELLVLRGAQPPGERTVRCLDLPGEGTEDRELEARRDGERWRFTRKDSVEVRGADGALVRTGREDHLGVVWLPATEASAADMSVTPPEALDAPETTAFGRLRVTRPGPDWRLMHHAEEDKTMIGVEHAAGVGVGALKLPMRMPEDPRERVRFAEAMRKSMSDARDNPTREGFELGAPEATTWRDLPAVRFELGGMLDNEPVAGEALLVGLGDGSTGLVFLAWRAAFTDLRSADVERARAALDLVDASEAPWTRRDFTHVTLELPEGWAAPSGGSLNVKSPMGASQVNVTAGRMPEGLTLEAAQAFWIQQQQKNPALTSFDIERQEEATVGGRTVQLAVTRAKLKENQGMSPEVRFASCLLDKGDGAYTEVIIVAFDLDWDLGAVERVLESVRWVEEH